MSWGLDNAADRLAAIWRDRVEVEVLSTGGETQGAARTSVAGRRAI